jgi:hypothetical protein
MASAMTLHDFVLDLLTDQQARAAFASDPAAALQHAGLSDISAQDVQDVVPLVLDSASVAPADGLPAFPTGELASGPAGAIQQLQFVAEQLPVSDAPHLTGGLASASGPEGFANAGGLGITAPMGGAYLGGAGWLHAPDVSQELQDGAQQLQSNLQNPSLSASRLAEQLPLTDAPHLTGGLASASGPEGFANAGGLGITAPMGGAYLVVRGHGDLRRFQSSGR